MSFRVKCRALAAARIQRWAIILSAFDYNIVSQKSEEHSNADGLSHCPLPETSDTGTAAASATVHSLLAEHLQQAPLNATQVARMTRTDCELAGVYKYVMEGWPSQVETPLTVFFTKRNDLTTEHGCVLWGTSVIVPQQMRKAVLKEIHLGHQGIVKTKALARKFVWWPGLESGSLVTDSQVDQFGGKDGGDYRTLLTPPYSHQSPRSLKLWL